MPAWSELGRPSTWLTVRSEHVTPTPARRQKQLSRGDACDGLTTLTSAEHIVEGRRVSVGRSDPPCAPASCSRRASCMSVVRSPAGEIMSPPAGGDGRGIPISPRRRSLVTSAFAPRTRWGNPAPGPATATVYRLARALRVRFGATDTSSSVTADFRKDTQTSLGVTSREISLDRICNATRTRSRTAAARHTSSTTMTDTGREAATPTRAVHEPPIASQGPS